MAAIYELSTLADLEEEFDHLRHHEISVIDLVSHARSVIPVARPSVLVALL